MPQRLLAHSQPLQPGRLLGHLITGRRIQIQIAPRDLQVRKTLAGYPRHVLHLKADDLVAAIAETGARQTP